MTQETAFAPFPTAQERSERTGEGEDTRDATPTRQSLNPTTSLSMIYLRAFARENATQPGKVRLSRKAMHMLRMHWAFVQHRRLAEWSDQ